MDLSFKVYFHGDLFMYIYKPLVTVNNSLHIMLSTHGHTIFLTKIVLKKSTEFKTPQIVCIVKITCSVTSSVFLGPKHLIYIYHSWVNTLDGTAVGLILNEEQDSCHGCCSILPITFVEVFFNQYLFIAHLN